MNSAKTTYVKVQLRIRSILGNKKGATMVEYSLVVGLIAVVAAAAVAVIGTDVSAVFYKVAPSIK